MRALLLAGGGGTRLWPLSSEERPKQFLPLLSEKSLLTEAYERLLPLTEDIFVATTENHADLVFSQLKSLPADRIVLEPARRNSGPALLSAALQFERDGDPVTAAIPSDQTVADADAFRRALTQAARVAESASAVVLAVAPSRPETDYGYLEVAESASGEGLEVVRFIEKPGREDAEACVRSGCFWKAAGNLPWRAPRESRGRTRPLPDPRSGGCCEGHQACFERGGARANAHGTGSHTVARRPRD